MPFSGLSDFVAFLEKNGELSRIKTFVDPALEITEITDRITKNGGKALLFENNGTQFPVLINTYGSDRRMAMALGRNDFGSINDEFTSLLGKFTGRSGSILKLLSSLKDLSGIVGFLPSKRKRKGKCQDVIIEDPDLSMLPVLKCWPHDGGRFITLPLVHTRHPVTGKTNVGMYRMQILNRNTTGMHWQRHKTGAAHYEAWKTTGKRMPVTVTLGGDPAYAYCASAPLPENIDEYILAGFIRRKKVKLVKCITNDLYVPSDSDFVIEGYVDPSQKPVLEGPFGDHTGFYSLADFYPEFHVTCITHSLNAVYPATIVGIPPQEDAWLTKATERIFLAPVKLAIQPEIEDFHMPGAGVAHNLVIVKINKSYPGQGKKVINSLWGAGQMMFTKYLIVTSGDADIRDYRAVARHILQNTDFSNDLLFSSGPLDILDHSSVKPALGGKLGIDGTIKLEEEKSYPVDKILSPDQHNFSVMISQEVRNSGGELKFIEEGILVLSVNQVSFPGSLNSVKEKIIGYQGNDIRVILVVDSTAGVNDPWLIAWQILGNSDCSRDIELISGKILFIDGTIKVFRKGFNRPWPEVVCSSAETISTIDNKWKDLGLGPQLPSPSAKYSDLKWGGNAEIIPTGNC